MGVVTLRPVERADVDVFFDHQCDGASIHMAAFTSKDPTDRAAHAAHWKRVLSNDANTPRSILVDGKVVGHIVGFERDGVPEVTYWIDRTHWGQGIATRALDAFLDELARRPLYARAAADNAASIRVLAKCGFIEHAKARGFAEARQEEIDEVVMVLR